MVTNSERRGELTLADFDYDLPADRIAQEPPPGRTEARLMLLPRRGPGEPEEATIASLPDLVRGDELIVMNDTRVLPARLRCRKPTGGRVELLALTSDGWEPEGRELVAMARSNKKLRPGQALLTGGVTLTVVEPLSEGRYRVALPPDGPDLATLLGDHGALPLPPYIERTAGNRPEDAERYQTVFATRPGAVAAPTAGLHFTRELLDRLRERGCQTAFVTLHVGPGTFLPVRTDRVAEHRMHHEIYDVPEDTAAAIASARREGRPILAVGTTVVRTLEAAAADAADGNPAPGRGSTDLFILPGYRFRVVDQLLTNFHLPGSTLLMLVSAFAGRERVLGAYEVAVERGFRFFSYGDAMWIR